MSNAGYALSYRAKWEHPIFRSKQEAAVWAWMTDVAQWMDHRLPTKFGSIDLKRGELIISERAIAEDFGLHRSAVRDLIGRMVDDGMIALFRDRIPARAGTVVKVVKYDDYQTIGRHVFGPQTGPQTGPQNEPQNLKFPTAKPEQNNEPYQEVAEDFGEVPNHKTADVPTANETANRTTNRPKNNTVNTVNTKEVSKVLCCSGAAVVPFPGLEGAAASSSPEAPKAKTGTRLPADWVLPKSWGDWAVEQGMTVDHIYQESEKFRDYWLAKAGAAARKADWLATWRNWVRTAMERNKGSYAHGRRGNDRIEDRNGWAVLNRRLEERANGSAYAEPGLWG